MTSELKSLYKLCNVLVGVDHWSDLSDEIWPINGSQLAKMKKSIPDMSLP